MTDQPNARPAAQSPAPEIERIEALATAIGRLISRARQFTLDAALAPMRNDHQGTWAAFEREIAEAAVALPSLLAERKELLRRVEEAEAREGVARQQQADTFSIWRSTFDVLLDLLERVAEIVEERDTLRTQLAEATEVTARQAIALEAENARAVTAEIAQERAVAEAWEAGREAAAKACEAHKPGHTLDLDGRLVDDLDGPWGLGSDFAAAIRALAPKAATATEAAE